MVAQPQFRAGRRGTFEDGRGAGRWMETSWHPKEGVVVLSLLQESTCRATFQLPFEDAPRLIHELAEALGQAALGPPVVPKTTRLHRFLWRVRRRESSEAADIISFRERRRR